jgi:alginate O-acetyltransferase complex protein AlgJ
MTEPSRPRSREDQAKIEIGQTEIRPGAKWALFLVGLFTLCMVPAVQTYRELRLPGKSEHGAAWPQWCDIFGALPRVAAAFTEEDGGWTVKVLRANDVLLEAIEEYEKDLNAGSFLTQAALPPTQELLIHLGGGNERGYVGRERWLFYRPDIEYCTGLGFLDPRHLTRRAGSGTRRHPAPQPDPRLAILQFHRQLAKRNIQLVLMPTPGKATIHPEKFSSRFDGRAASVHNPSYRPLLDELEAEGVLVCDVTDVLARYRDRSGKSAFLATDTHWRPEAMELAAEQLAGFLQEKVLPRATTADRTWRRTARTTENLGDIAMMLKLPPNQGVFKAETVTIHQVTDAQGVSWRPDPAAEILVLGDSFANIYSLEMMNWGSGAGLVEQLSFALNRPVDAILRNDEGACATRELLSRELAQGHDRLAGKKVVVWQFAARELTAGNWRLLDMKLEQPTGPTVEPPLPSCELIVSGTVAARSAAPRAGMMPYADHIFTVDLVDLQVEQGTLNDPRIAVYLFSMRNHANTPAFSWPMGKRVQLRLRPWKPGFFAHYGRINRTETDDSELEHPWWGEVIQ